MTFGEERGDIRVLWNSPTTLGYHWQGELTGAGGFGEERGDIRVFWNSPAPVTLERSEMKLFY